MKEIIEAMAAYVARSGFSVEIDNILPSVSIVSGKETVFFMQEWQCDSFFDEMKAIENSLAEENQELNEDVIALAATKAYIDCL